MQETRFEQATDEVVTLRRRMNDLISLFALPAAWSGAGPAQITRTFVDAVARMLEADLVYLKLYPTAGGDAAEIVKTGPKTTALSSPREADAALGRALGEDPGTWPARLRARLAGVPCSILTMRLGALGDLGVMAVASERQTFADDAELLLLTVAANQAVIAVQNARLLDEQTRLAIHLDQRVAERTRELAEVNAALNDEIAERRRTEEALRVSERNLRSVIDGIPGLVATLAPSGEIEAVNRQIVDYTGQHLDELERWGENGTVHPDDLGHVAAIFTRSIAAGTPYDIEQRLRRFDGAYRWFGNRGIPARDGAGRIVRWYVLLTDLEDRKRAESQLQGEKKLLEMIASGRSLREVLGALCEFVEGATADCHCGVYPIDWAGPSFQCGVAPSLPASYTAPIERLPVAGDVAPCGIAAFQNVQVIATDIDSDPRWRGSSYRTHVLAHGLRSVWSTPICSREGSVLGTFCIYRRTPGSPSAHHQDLIGHATHIASIAIERSRADTALDKVRSELAHVTRTMSLGVLTASIAHEVNQPLSGIITNASTCLRMLAATPPNVEGALETARRTIRDGNRASEVVGRLRALFRKKEVVMEDVDLNEATREVLALSGQELQRRRIVLQTELDAALPPVSGDRVQLQQVILNLLLNAFDAVATVDGRPRQIVIRTSGGEDGTARLTVQDSGVGVLPEALDKLFEAFYTTKADGMGIGLSVSRSIIESHHGRLWCEPPGGPGAIFAFSIPVAARPPSQGDPHQA